VQRLSLDLKRVERLRDEWKATWPEAEQHFARVKQLGPAYPAKFSATVETLFTRRFRGGAGYCATANNGFQALLADCAKEAMWRVAEEQYVIESSPLFNTRTVAFVHDEIIGEAREEVAHEAAVRLADVMVAAANMYLPDVPIPRAKVKPVLMRRWSKKAKPTFVDGRLVPWAA
jgi:DNA polymerase-1